MGCRGVNLVETDPEESDFETWSPSDRFEQNCLLGHTDVYTRRKRDARCFQDRNEPKTIFREHCACTYEDFQCRDEFYIQQGDWTPSMIFNLNGMKSDYM